MKKLLVISFTFPPAEGIGGRRWAKFAKYMLRQGVDVQVLAARIPYAGKSEWTGDIQQLSDEGRIHYFDTNYPGVLIRQPVTLFDKVNYRLARASVRRRIKGNFYDKSALCRHSLSNAVESFVKKGYKNIVLSIGPFYYSTFLSGIRQKYPDVNLILDVRDPWTNNKTSFGYAALEPRRLMVEKAAEKLTANLFDRIVSVADDMGNYFVTEYGVPASKTLTIRNGFDMEDIPEYDPVIKERKNIVFTGNLYEKSDPSFRMFYKQFQDLKANNKALFDQYEFHFYGEIHPSMAHYFAEGTGLYFHDRIPLHEVYERIGSSSACMLFLTDDLNYSFSTKFYEYLGMKKPILVFSKPGKTGDFVEQHNIGKQMHNDNLQAVISSLDKDAYYNSAIDIAEYDVRNLAMQYAALLKD